MPLISSVRMRRGLSASGYVCFVMGIALTATTADFFTLLRNVEIRQVCIPRKNAIVTSVTLRHNSFQTNEKKCH